MTFRTFGTASICLLAVNTAISAAEVPAELRGKSISLSWTESREQKSGAASEYRSVNVAYTGGIYVSSAGRLFVRLSAQGPGRQSTGASNEQVGGSGKSLGGGARSVRFEGGKLMFQAAFGNFARSIRVSFDGAFAGCSATHTVGKLPGSRPTAFTNTAGLMLEFRTVSVGATSCSIKSGNVFQ